MLHTKVNEAREEWSIEYLDIKRKLHHDEKWAVDKVIPSMRESTGSERKTRKVIIFTVTCFLVITRAKQATHWRGCLEVLYLGAQESTTTTATRTKTKLAYLTMKNYFCTLCTRNFNFRAFHSHSGPFDDVKWSVLPLCGRREHLTTTFQFCFLFSKALIPI